MPNGVYQASSLGAQGFTGAAHVAPPAGHTGFQITTGKQVFSKTPVYTEPLVL